jgi:hypothetical protein
MNMAMFVQTPTSNKVADPTFSPAPGGYNVYPSSNKTVNLNDSNMSAHIFYTKDGSSPTHSGDSPLATTFRIGAHSGTVVIPGSHGGTTTDISMLAYVNGLADSNIVTGEYVIDIDSGA